MNCNDQHGQDKSLPVNGCTFDFSIDAKGKKVNISRLGTDINGDFRILNISAKGMEIGKVLCGNSCLVKFDKPVDLITREIFNNGFEHHYSVIMSDISNVLKEIAFWKNINTYFY